MSTPPSPELPAAQGVTVGQLAPRSPVPRHVLRIIAIVLLVMAGCYVAALGLTVAWGGPADAWLFWFPAFLATLAATTAVSYLHGRVTELAAQLGPDGIRLTAGTLSLSIPWDAVQRLWLVRGGSAMPVLCLAIRGPVPLAAAGAGWRLKALVHRHLFGTPVAVPLAGTGVDEHGLAEVIRAYRPHAAALAPGPPAATHRRAQGLVLAGLAVPATVVAGAGWVGFGLSVPALPDGLQGVLGGIVGLLGALAATLAAAAVATTLYQILVPLTRPAGGAGRPLLRIGPAGVEYVVGRHVARVPWAEVVAIYPARLRDRSGAPVVCVATTEPTALLPRGAGGSRLATHQQRRYGTPVAVPLVGSGLPEADFWNAVRHFSGAG